MLLPVGQLSPSTINADALGMIQKQLHLYIQMQLSAGFQFVEFRAPNGLIIKVEVDSNYDDEVRNKIRTSTWWSS